MSTRPNDWDRDERDALEGLGDQLDAIRRRHQDDPPLELLRAASGDALPGELQAAVSQHLADSSWSRALLEGAEPVDGVFDPSEEARVLGHIKKRAAAERQATTPRKWLLPALVASTLSVAAVVAWLARGDQGGPAPPIGTPEATVAVASPPSPPSFQVPFEKADVKLSVAALTWRGSSTDNQLLADLKPALDAYRADNFAAADREFTTLASRYPRTTEVFFYQGVTRLLLDDPAGAITALMTAESLTDETFASDILWYRAVAEQRAGHEAETRTRLTSLCNGTSDRAARACETLKQLESPN